MIEAEPGAPDMTAPEPGAPDVPAAPPPDHSWTDMRWSRAVAGAVVMLCGAALTGAGVAALTSGPPMVEHLVAATGAAVAGVRGDAPQQPAGRESGAAAQPSQLVTARPTRTGAPRPAPTTGAAPAAGPAVTTTAAPPPPAPSVSTPTAPGSTTTAVASPAAT